VTRKQAGIIDSLMMAPLSGLAGAIIAPSGSRAQAGGLGAILGTGMAALANQEYEQKKLRGEPVNPIDFAPMFKAILAGIAAGGVMRAYKQRQETGQVSTGNAILAGVPAGAMLFPGHPIIGAIIGGVAGPMAAKATNPPEKTEVLEDPSVRAHAAYLAAQARMKSARQILLARYQYIQSILDARASQAPQKPTV